jgi:hypothetical protein
LKIGRVAKAEELAKEMLAEPDLPGKTGDGVYYANHVMGMIALRRGDTASAKLYLVESARTPGSPWLDQGTQYTGLAEALLKFGEREAVIEYVVLCKRFWKRDATLLDKWEATIRAGGVPRFDQDRQDK